MSESLRFCMITTFYPPYNFGGDGIFVQRLSEALARHGHRVDVVHCANAFRFFERTPRAVGPATHPGIRVHTLESPAGALSPFLTQQTGRPAFKHEKLARILEDGSFDVIHYHNASLVAGPGAFALGSGVKLYTTHEYWLVCPLSTLWKFNRVPCRKRNCLACMMHARRPPQLWRWTGLLEREARHIQAFLAPSRQMIERHRAMGLDLPFVHMPNFLPRPEAAPNRPGAADPEPARSDQRPFFLYVGRLEKHKGVQELIRAFRDYDRADLLIAGHGGYRRTLRRLAQKTDRIRFLGQLDYDRLQQLYRDATAVVVPSLWDEPFGLILLEAFVQGTPVIAHDMGAPPEIVRKSGGGRVYRTRDELIAAVDALVSDPALRDSLGERGRQAYERHWTEERHLARYLKLIRRLRAGERAS